MIFVTGGTGLVGSQLLFDLVSSGEKVRALVREGSNLSVVQNKFGGMKDLFDGIEWYRGDVNDLFSLEEAMEGIESVYHAAAFVSFSPRDSRKMMKVNIEGTANVVNMSAKKNIKRFCHVSSTSALGREGGTGLIDENSWWKPSKENSNYSISKYGAEREVWRGMEEGLDAFIINPSIIIGEGNWRSGSSQMFSQVWKGLSFYSDGSSSFVDVRDVSKAAIALMKKGVKNERFIISGENVSYRYVFDLIAENFGKKKASFRVTPSLASIGWRFEKMKSFITGKSPMITKETARNAFQQFHYSNEKIKKEIGIEFISVEETIKESCKIFLKDVKDKILK